MRSKRTINQRDIMGDLTKNFSKHEFACRCGCGFDDANKIFIFKLQLAREGAGISFPINSGCRCVQYNQKVGGSKSSDHLTGEGADVGVANSRNRFRVVEAAIEAGFDRIGIAKTFVHLGTSSKNTSLVMWVY